MTTINNSTFPFNTTSVSTGTGVTMNPHTFIGYSTFNSSVEYGTGYGTVICRETGLYLTVTREKSEWTSFVYK